MALISRYEPSCSESPPPSYLTPIRYPGNDNNWSTQNIPLKAFKFSWFRIFYGTLTTKFCTDLCEEPGRLRAACQADPHAKSRKTPLTIAAAGKIAARSSPYNRLLSAADNPCQTRGVKERPNQNQFISFPLTGSEKHI